MKLSAISSAEFRTPNAEFQNTRSNSARDTRHPALGTRHSALETRTPEDAAKAFEKVLVQQFVNVMTDQMFKSNLSGEDGPGWLQAYGDTQRRTLSDVLTNHLVDQGTFNISSLILEQWRQRGLVPGE